MKRALWCSPFVGLALVAMTGAAQATEVGAGKPHTTPQPITTPRPAPTAIPSAIPSPTATPIRTCGHNVCLVVTPTPTPDHGPGTTASAHAARCDVLDPGTWVPCLAAGGIQLVTSWVDDLVNTAAVADIWTHTDPALTYANPVVVRYWDGIRRVGDALLVLLVLGVAGEMLLCANSGHPYAGALDRFWRLLLVAALANGSLALIAQAIDLANLATGVLDAIQQGPLLGLAAHGGSHTANAVLLEAVLALIDGVMELLLLLQMLVRLALLDVLTVLAAPALLCYAWPRLQHWAALWSRLFIATLITQFIQIAALRLGEDLALTAPLVVLPGNPTHVVGATPLTDLRTWMQYLISFGVFVVVLRVPRLLNNHAGHAVTPLAVALWAARTFSSGGRNAGATRGGAP
jgi:hypothetical protein